MTNRQNKAERFLSELIRVTRREMLPNQYNEDYIATDLNGNGPRNYHDGLTRQHFLDCPSLVGSYIAFYAISPEARERGIRVYPQRLKYIDERVNTLFDFIHKQIKDNDITDHKRLSRQISDVLIKDRWLPIEAHEIERDILKIAQEHGIRLSVEFPSC